MSEELVVKHCSPTLAGIKTGNIFSCRFEDEDDMKTSIRSLNRMLLKKGIRILPLRHQKKRTLLYVFRPGFLAKDLSNDMAERILEERGYTLETPEKCVVSLIKRLEESADFPHEIGLFLGYPPEDVCGFIENKAEDYKCIGCWKVYGDEEKAKEIFAKYKKCTEIYCNCFKKGITLDKLAVEKKKFN